MTNTRPTPGIAIAALVLSILCPPVGVVLGIVAYSKIKRSNGALGGDGLALAAIILPAAMVPIVGILAAIAIPNFIRFQLRSKQSEARVVLRSIQTAQESYYAEHNVYFAAAPNPSTLPGTVKASWDARPCPSDCSAESPEKCTEFACGEVDPGRSVYYQYACSTLPPDADGKAYYTCVAVGDLDGDGERGALLVGNGEGSIRAPIPQIAANLCPDDATAGVVYDCQHDQF